MNNWDRLKEIMDVEEVRECINPFCDAVHKLRQEEMCKITCVDCKEWLKQEYKPQILTNSEREYLSAVIKPWIDKVDNIVKYNYDGEQFIQISIKDSRDIDLPCFKRGSMYKGMTVGRKYSLQELEILE